MQNIRARTIVEMLGAPKEYVEATLRNYIEKLKKEGLVIVNQEFAEAKEQGKLFSSFAELEIVFKSMPELLDFCFDAMPSSVDILEPEELMLHSRDFTNFINDLQAKLHEADMIIKGVTAQKRVLDANALNVFNNFIFHLLRQGPKRIEEISQPLGLESKEMMQFLQKLVERNLIVEKDGFYEIK